MDTRFPVIPQRQERALDGSRGGVEETAIGGIALALAARGFAHILRLALVAARLTVDLLVRKGLAQQVKVQTAGRPSTVLVATGIIALR
jgi:hypothetical protein